MLIVHIIRMYLSQNNFTEHALNNDIIVLRPHNTSIMKLLKVQSCILELRDSKASTECNFEVGEN